MKKTLLVSVLCLAVQASAQEQGLERPSGVLSLLRFSAGQENQPIVGEGTVSDTVFLVAPSFDGLKRYSGTTELAFYYQPEFDVWTHHSDLNSINHVGRASLSQKITPRLVLSTGDSFALTKDPSRQLAYSFLVVPRGRYKENSFYFNADYNLTPRTLWSARFDNRIVRFGLTPEFRSGFLDQMGNSFSTAIAHTFTPQHRLTISYSLLRITLLDNGESIDFMSRTSNNHLVSATYSYTFSPDFNFSVTGGAIRANGYSYLVGSQVVRRLGSMWLDAGYTRSIGFANPVLPANPALDPGLTNGFVATSYYQMGSVGLRGGITHRLGLDLRAGIVKNNATATTFKSRNYVALGRLNYRVSERIMLFTTAELYSYGQDLNDLLGGATRRTRFFGGLEIGLSPGSHPEALLPGSGISAPAQRPATTQATEDK